MAHAEQQREPQGDSKPPTDNRQRLATVFGWLSGGALGLVTNYGLLLAFGQGYPTTYTTFALFLVGAFGGMWVADRLGPRAFKPLGIAAGILLAVFVGLVLAVFMAPPSTP